MNLKSTNIPDEILTILNGENYDFIIHSKITAKIDHIIFLFTFSFIGLFFVSFLLYFAAKENELAPMAILTTILFVWLLFLLDAIRMVIRQCWYIGTQEKLIIYKKNQTQKIYWNEFNTLVDVEKNNIRLYLNDSILSMDKVNYVSREGSRGYQEVMDSEYVIDINVTENISGISDLIKKRISDSKIQ